MENETKENETPTNEEEVVEETTTEETEEETPETLSDEDVADLKKKAGLADNYKIRAEKAEGKLKKQPPTKKEEVAPQDNLSQNDVIYLAKTDIHEEDIEEVTKYAKANEVTVKEAHAYLRPILDVRGEERKTAAATQTKGGARGGSKTDGSSILEKAESTGEVPNTAEGMTKMAEARIARAKGN